MVLIIAFHLILLALYSSYVWKELYFKGWSAFVYSSLYIILFYLISPIISLVYIEVLGNKGGFVYNIPDLSDVIVISFTFLVILISVISFLLGYSRTKAWKIVSINDRYWSNVRVSTLLAFLFLFTSLGAMAIYINGVGSFDRAVQVANMIRAGIYAEQTSGDTSYTFFYRFMFLAIIPFWYCFYDSNEKKSNIRFFLFPVSTFLLFLTYIYLSSGRQSIIDVFLMLLLASLIKQKKIISTKLIMFAIVAFIALPILTTFFVSKTSEVNNVESASFITTFIREFGFPYYSLIYSIKESYSFYFFLDFVEGLFGTIFPSSMNPGLEGVNYLNTYYMMGVKMKSVPPGVFAFGFYSLGIIGVFLVGFFTGKLFKIIDVFFRSIIELKPSFVFFYVFFILNTLSWIRTGLPHNYFYHTVNLCFILFIFLSFKMVKKRGIN